MIGRRKNSPRSWSEAQLDDALNQLSPPTVSASDIARVRDRLAVAPSASVVELGGHRDRRKRTALVPAAAAAAVLLVVGGTAVALQHRPSPHRTNVAAVGNDHVAAQNILVIGTDNTAGATAAEKAAMSSESDTDNADTVMLMHLPARGGPASVISLPRDSYVDVPGYGMNRLNAAYALPYAAAKKRGDSEIAAQSDGILETAKTVSALTGLHIDHYVQLNLLGFYRISNAIGGVPVCLLHAQKDSFSGIDLPAGKSTIKGAQALAFVRQRHGLLNGDLDRIKRQEYFLSAAENKLMSLDTLPKSNAVVKAISSSMVTDPSLNLLTLAEQLPDRRVTFSTVPTSIATVGAGTGEMSVLAVDAVQIKKFISSIVSPGRVAVTSPSQPKPNTNAAPGCIN